MSSFLSPLRWAASAQGMRWLRPIGILCGFAAIFWICTFKIMDRDFWWHVKAGEIMMQTFSLIHTDPFAYTRAGLPYLATHEWLAQIMLALIFRTFGSTGIILFRGVIASVSVGLLMLLGRRHAFPNILLAVWAVVIAKGSILERPQLFTFVLFSFFLLLAFLFLDSESWRKRMWICVTFILAELFWVNVHGAAALVGCAVVTLLLLQEGYRWWRSRAGEGRRTILLLCGTLAWMSLVLVAPPNGFGTLRYLWNLLNDQTILYIAEWRPRAWPLYIAELWPFWLIALASLWCGRRHKIFTALLLIMTAYLSRQAFRHEVLFVLAALAVCFYQLERGERAQALWAWLAKRRIAVALIAVPAVILLGRVAYARSVNFERQDNLFGFGQFDLARGAYDFIQREHVTGNMFNTYGIGGYLIYRGYPDRKVFIDGRNVDYGMDFLTHTYAAGINPAEWKELAERYDVGYALIDYDAIQEKDRLPYSVILDRDSEWPLVYLDDWVAVYLKNSAANQSVIDRLRYKHLTATGIQFNKGFSDVAEKDLPDLIKELQRMQRSNPQGVKATLALAAIALHQGRMHDARDLADDALRIRPRSPEPYAILGAAYVSEQLWDQAAEAYDMLLKLAGNSYPDINHVFIAGVFEKAGRIWKARYLRLGSHDSAVVPTAGTGTVLSLSGTSLMANPAADAYAFNEKGIAEAEQGKSSQAEQSFRTAIMLNPGFAEAWNNLCAFLVSQQRTADAIDACRRAIEILPELADAHFNLALAHYHRGSLQESEKEALLAKKLGRTQESDGLLLLIRKRKNVK